MKKEHYAFDYIYFARMRSIAVHGKDQNIYMVIAMPYCEVGFVAYGLKDFFSVATHGYIASNI